jgi:hypothetical protein
MRLTRDLNELLLRDRHHITRRDAAQHGDDPIDQVLNGKHAGERHDKEQRGEEREEKVKPERRVSERELTRG